MKKLTWLLMSLMLFLGMGTAFADVTPPTFNPGDGGSVTPGQSIDFTIADEYSKSQYLVLAWTFDPAASVETALANIQFPNDMGSLTTGGITGITGSMGQGISQGVDADTKVIWQPVVEVPGNATGSITLKVRFACVVNGDWVSTGVIKVNYTVGGAPVTIPTPEFSPAAGPLKSGSVITLSCEPSGNVYKERLIAYAINNENVDFTQYTGDQTDGEHKLPGSMQYPRTGESPIVIDADKKVTAAVYVFDWGTESITEWGEKVTVSYEVVNPPAAPVFSQAGGAVPAGTKITLSADKPIYYNIKKTGSEEFDKVKTRSDLNKAVTDISGKLKAYPAAGIDIPSARTINAAAIEFDALDNVIWSEVKTEDYTIAVSKPDKPVFSPDGGAVANGVPAITLSTTCGDCEIYYVINGSDDDFWPETADDFGLGGSLEYYESPIALTANAEIKAAVAQYNDEGEITWSDIETKSFTVTGDAPETVEKPVITPGNDATVHIGDMVTITCETEEAEIWYTTDGTAPYTDNGIKDGALEYTAPFELTESMLVKVGEVYELRIRAVATKGDLMSEGASAGYVVYPNAPEFSVASGVVEEGTTVTISCVPSVADIYYTTDGTLPSMENSPKYTEPITITERTTLRAISVLGQYQASASAVYTIKGDVTLTFNPVSGSEVNEGTAVAITADADGVDIFYMMFESEEAAKAAEWDQEAAILYGEMTPVVSLEKNTVKAAYAYEGAEALEATFFYATYTVKELPAIELTFDPASGAEVEDGTTITVTANREAEILYNLYINEEAADADEAFMLNAKEVAEDGMPVITKDNTYLRCAVFDKGAMQYFNAVYTIKEGKEPVVEPVATPVFSIAAGEVEKGTEVSIACETKDAVIYYTVNGDEPTALSTPYETAIVINEAMTVKAIAIKGEAKSDVATAAYTIKPEGPSSANEDEELAGVSVYPNPSNGVVNIELPVAATVEVFAINGVLFQRMEAAAGNVTLNINRSGIYFLRITGEGRTAIKRIIVR